MRPVRKTNGAQYYMQSAFILTVSGFCFFVQNRLQTFGIFVHYEPLKLCIFVQNPLKTFCIFVHDELFKLCVFVHNAENSYYFAPFGGFFDTNHNEIQNFGISD